MLSGIEQGVKGVRVGYDSGYASDGVDPELARAVLAGVEVLRELGAEVIEVQMPDVDSYLPAWPVLCSAEAVAAHRDHYPDRRDDYGPWFRGWLDKGSGVTGADYAKANNMRAECNGRIREAFQDIDILACPSTIGPPHAVTPEALYGPMDDRRGTSFQRYTVPYDFNGMPTLSLPCGLNTEGLPLSLQLVGKHLSEQMLCRIGHAYEEATEWHFARPPA
jgi:amidase